MNRLERLSLIGYPFPTVITVRGLIAARLGIYPDGAIMTVDRSRGRVHHATLAALDRRGWVEKNRSGLIVTSRKGTAVANWLEAVSFKIVLQSYYLSLADIFFGNSYGLPPADALAYDIYRRWRQSVLESVKREVNK